MNKKRLIILSIILTIVALLIIYTISTNGNSEKENNNDKQNSDSVEFEIDGPSYVIDKYISILQNADRIASNEVKDNTENLLYENISSLELSQFNSSIFDEFKDYEILEEHITEEKSTVKFKLVFEFAEFIYEWNLTKDETWKINLDLSRDSNNIPTTKKNAEKNYSELDAEGIWFNTNTEGYYLLIEKENSLYTVKECRLMKYSSEENELTIGRRTYPNHQLFRFFRCFWSNLEIYEDNQKMYSKTNIYNEIKSFELIEIGEDENSNYYMGEIKNIYNNFNWDENTGFIKNDNYVISVFSSSLSFEEIKDDSFYKFPYDFDASYTKTTENELMGLY